MDPREFLAAVRQRAEAQRAAHARMLELGGGVGLLGVRYPQMFEDMLAWDNASENDHADTVLSLVAFARSVLGLADELSAREADSEEQADAWGEVIDRIDALAAALTLKEND